MKITVEIRYEYLPVEYWQCLKQDWEQESSEWYDLLPEYDINCGCGFSCGPGWFSWTTCGDCSTTVFLYPDRAEVTVEGYRSGCRWPWNETPTVLVPWNGVFHNGSFSKFRKGHENKKNELRKWRTLSEHFRAYFLFENRWIQVAVIKFESRVKNLPWQSADWSTSRYRPIKIGTCTVYGDIIISDGGDSRKLKQRPSPGWAP